MAIEYADGTTVEYVLTMWHFVGIFIIYLIGFTASIAISYACMEEVDRNDTVILAFFTIFALLWFVYMWFVLAFLFAKLIRWLVINRKKGSRCNR